MKSPCLKRRKDCIFLLRSFTPLMLTAGFVFNVPAVTDADEHKERARITTDADALPQNILEHTSWRGSLFLIDRPQWGEKF